MQINKIGAIEPKFKSNNKSNRFGYDDLISQERRDFLRENILNHSMPYYSILENNGRLEKYQLEKLIGTLYGEKMNQDSLQSMLQRIKQHKINANKYENIQADNSVNRKLIEDLPLWNLAVVSDKLGIYRGQSLQGNWEALKVIKKAGIGRVVDLAGYENLEADCKELGLEYLHYPMSPYLFMNNSMFKSEEENKLKFFNQSRLFGYKNKQQQIYINKMMDNWHKDKNKEIDSFIKFIQFMQKGKLYIGCEWGTYTTDNALMLNCFFNPHHIRIPHDRYISSNNRIYIKRVEKLYKNFTAEHKEAMGWTKEFEKRVQEKFKIFSRIFL